MPVRRGLASLLCLALLALSACSDDGDAPGAEPTQSVTDEPTLEPTPTGPSIPPEAQGTDEASAKAFVRYWFEVFSQAMVTGKTDQLRALSSTQCETCRSFIELIDKRYSRGGSIRSDGWSVTRQVRRAERSSMTLDIIVQIGDEEFLKADGTVARSADGRLEDFRATLETRTGSWSMKELELYR